MRVNELEWDSHFFKKKVGELNIDNGIIENLLDFDVVYAKSDKKIKLTIPKFELSASETKIVFIKDIKVPNIFDLNIRSAFSSGLKAEDLYELALISGEYSRFNKDNKFSYKEFVELYKKWVDNSFDNNYADDILVYVLNEKIVGFVTYKINNEEAKIGLIATDSNQQGKGIGTKLLNAVENKLFRLKIKTLEIPTQMENIIACKFYDKNGYSIKEKIYINHYWQKYDTI